MLTLANRPRPTLARLWPNEIARTDYAGRAESVRGADAVKAVEGSLFHLDGQDGPDGFADLADFLRECRFSEAGGRYKPTPRAIAYALAIKSVTGLNEGFLADGAGLAAPSGVVERIWQSAISTDGPLGMCTRRYTPGNTYSFIAWANHNLANGSRFGGLRARRYAEGDVATKDTPKVRTVERRLTKLMVAVDLTEELAEDGAFIEEDLDTAVAEELRFTLENEMIRGTGGAQLGGVLGAPCKVKIDAEASQVTATIVAQNIAKMWARMPGSLRAEAVWNINEDADPQLLFSDFPGGTAGANPNYVTYQPPGAVAGSPYAHLMGRPVVPTPQCSTLGTEGDIILAAWSQYGLVSKVNPINRRVSAHVRFDVGNVALQWWYRSSGAPLWEQPRTPLNGTNTQSPFITLATR